MLSIIEVNFLKMGKSFSTVNPKLFLNNNDSNIPEWMNDMRENVELYIKDNSLDIEFENRTAFSEGKTLNRDEMIANSRNIQASFNDKKAELDSKIDLSKFLNGKYYKTTTKVACKSITLNTTIDGINAEFDFKYNFNNGKVSKNDVFIVNNDAEYPFSKAGFDECLADIKKGMLKTSKKVESSRSHYVINREEIIRRYDGHIREASDKINQYVKEGMIVGVSSNTYATFYDPDVLFPKMEKQIPQNKLGSFEFVKNKEHSVTNEVKSNNNLSIEASKILSDVFKDHKILNVARDGNELLVKANILNNNGRTYNIDFNFDIKNEKVASLKLAEYNDQRMSIKDLLKNINESNLINKLASKNFANRIYNGSIISQRDLNSKLSPIISNDKINDFIDGLVELGALKEINSTTYASDMIIDDLINLMKFEKISDDEVDQIISYSKKDSNIGVNRIDKRDFGTRSVVESNNKEKSIFAANAFLASKFNNFIPKNIEYNDGNINYEMELFDSKSGLKNKIAFSLEMENNKVKSCKANINGKEYSLENVINSFAKNDVLSRYLQVNSGKKVDAPMIITKENLFRKLSKVSKLNEKSLNTVINNWEKLGKINNLYENIYASKYTLESLISMSNLKALSNDDINREISASNRNKSLRMRSEHIKANDTRLVSEEWSDKNKELHAKSQIGSMFNNFKILDINNNKDNYSVIANVLNPINGTNINLKFDFDTNNNKTLGAIASISNGIKSVSKNNILELLDNDNDIFNNSKKSNFVNNNKNIYTLNSLKKSLENVSDDYKECISKLEDYGLITKIASNNYASEYSIGNLIKYLDNNDMLNVEAVKKNLKQYVSNENHIDRTSGRKYNHDSRILTAKVDRLTPELVETKNKLTKLAENCLNSKKITKNKFNSLNEMLKTANNSNDIESIWKEIKRYIK